MKRVIIESPLAGNFAPNDMSLEAQYARRLNKEYARKCMRDSLMRGEAPLASHLLYDQEGILNDTVSHERIMGMEAGFAWGEKADLVAVYTDRGISSGMKAGMDKAERNGIPSEYRTIPDYQEPPMPSPEEFFMIEKRRDYAAMLNNAPLTYGFVFLMVSNRKDFDMWTSGAAVWEIIGMLDTALVRVKDVSRFDNKQNNPPLSETESLPM